MDEDVLVKDVLLPEQIATAEGFAKTVGAPVDSPTQKSPKPVKPNAWVLPPVSAPVVVVLHAELL